MKYEAVHNFKVKLHSQLEQIRAEKHEQHCKLVADSSGHHEYLLKSYANNTIGTQRNFDF